MDTWQLGHRPGLDGLRGLAIAAVVWMHSVEGVYPHYHGIVPGGLSGGGLVGVQLFFVLSGFLITRLLIEEHRGTGAVALGRFTARRCRRLLPALGALVLTYVVLRVTVDPAPIGTTISTAARSLLYLEDLQGLVRLPSDGWLGHTWSLAVEQQFYLVWPVLFLGAMRHGGRYAAMAVAIGAMAVTVAVRAVIFPSALAYTLWRWDALAIGALLAFVPAWRPSRAVVATSGALLLLLVVRAPSADANVYYLVTAAASAVLVLWALSGPRALTVAPLVSLGRISYSLYLFHMLPLRLGWHPVVALPVGLVVSLVAHRAVEEPFRRRRARLSEAPARGAGAAVAVRPG